LDNAASGAETNKDRQAGSKTSRAATMAAHATNPLATIPRIQLSPFENLELLIGLELGSFSRLRSFASRCL
jgi:hypothetical protein